MEDFVVRRFDTNTFNSLYFGKGGLWVNSSEEASKFCWDRAEFIRTWCVDKNESAIFDLIIRKDAYIARITEALVTL